VGGWGVGRVFALFGEQCVGASGEVSSICWEINEIPHVFETCVCVRTQSSLSAFRLVLLVIRSCPIWLETLEHYFELVDSQRSFTIIRRRMPWPEGFRGRIPCPEFLVGCSSLFKKKLPIPIMSLAKPGSKQEESPVYQTAPGCPGPVVKLARNCTMEVLAKQVVLGHIAIDVGRRRWFVSAEIDLPEFAIFGGWINIWMGEGDHVGGVVTQNLIGTLYCTLSLDSRWLNAKPDNGYVCMCGRCEEEWLDQGWICELIRFSTVSARQHLQRTWHE
jgi:hypothetical protein